jgi:PAS domain S-box-containing protein
MSTDKQFEWQVDVRRLILCAAALSALAIPLIYLLFNLEEQKISMRAEAHILAHNITDQINKNPEYWQFQENRFSALLRHRLDDGNYHEIRQLLDNYGSVVAESQDSLLPPLISVEEQVFDAGSPAGVLRITRSIRSILLASLVVVFVSIVCGVLVYLVLYIFPLRALKSAFVALHAEKEQATVTLQSIADAVITTDSSLQILSLNPAAIQLSGVEESRVKGQPFLEHFNIVHPQYRDNMEVFFAESLKSQTNARCLRELVVVVRQYDSKKFQAELTVSPLRDQRNKLLGLVIVLHDVTESRELERQLREKVLELGVIVKYAGVGISFIRGGIVQEINSIAAEIVGLPQEEIVGKSSSSFLLAAIGYDGSLENIHRRLSCGEIFDTEHRVVRSDQKEIWVRLIGQAVDPNRLSEVGSVWIVQDITRLKQQQEELQIAKAHAEAASKFKTEFLAQVSHDLRSPMSGIIGMNQLVLETDLNEIQRKYLNIVQTTSENLLLLINNLLDLSKIEAGVMELDEKPFNLGTVYEYIRNIVSLGVQKKGLLLTFSASDDVPEVLIGDELRLGQILLNLVGNAVKFTLTGGIKVTCEKIAQSDKTVQLKFEVIDSGCGISKSEQKKVFGAFVQASSSVTRAHGGSGLGLSICKKLTELLGGAIEVVSEPGVGSTFTFTAWFNYEGPADKIPAVIPQKVAEPEVDSQQQPLRILLVEDIPFNQTLGKLLLESENHSVQVTANGQEALEAISMSDFDAIFMDVQMPVMDGLTATRLIRQCEKENTENVRGDDKLMKAVFSRIHGKHIPIIAMTGNATENCQCECIAAGMDNYIVKPFDRLEIIRVLNMVCRELASLV